MGETTKAILSGAASGLAPYVALGVGFIFLAGIIEAKFDVMGNTAAAKAAMDTEIKTQYAEKVYTIDAAEVQRAVDAGDIRALSDAEAAVLQDQIGEIDIMTADQLAEWAKDPVKYQEAYGKAHGWEV